jgi:hypothetical protein
MKHVHWRRGPPLPLSIPRRPYQGIARGRKVTTSKQQIEVEEDLWVKTRGTSFYMITIMMA